MDLHWENKAKLRGRALFHKFGGYFIAEMVCKEILEEIPKETLNKSFYKEVLYLIENKKLG